MFSWLVELVPVFRLMVLDLVFLKGSAVSSSRFCSVCGLSMPLGSPSLRSVAAAAPAKLLQSCESIFTAASKCLSQHICSAASPVLVPGIIAGNSVPLSHPALLAETS